MVSFHQLGRFPSSSSINLTPSAPGSPRALLLSICLMACVEWNPRLIAYILFKHFMMGYAENIQSINFALKRQSRARLPNEIHRNPRILIYYVLCIKSGLPMGNFQKDNRDWYLWARNFYQLFSTLRRKHRDFDANFTKMTMNIFAWAFSFNTNA